MCLLAIVSRTPALTPKRSAVKCHAARFTPVRAIAGPGGESRRKPMPTFDMPKTYDPAASERRIYEWWEKSGFFKPEIAGPDAKPFVISIPPPNITGELHLGHAMFVSLEDLMIRYKRMRGYAALWVPGLRPRRHRHAAPGGEDAAPRRASAARTSAARSSCAAPGPGRRSTAATSCASSAAWARRATGIACASPWTRGSAAPCARRSCASTAWA